jgi:putative hydrolase of the HAD superfamily
VKPAIQAVTFDVGGTLIEPWPSVGEVYARVAARLGAGEVAADRVQRQFHEAWRRRPRFDYSRDGWAQMVAESFAGLITRPRDERLFEAVYEEFAGPGAWRIHDDVLPTLDQLASRGIALGIVSNWDERLLPLLRALGLADYFEAIVISCDVGFTKPSPVIFEQAARKLGLPAEAILHIGDNPQTDVAGARSAGFRALELDRAAAPSPGRVASLAVVLDELESRKQAGD